MNSIKHKIFLLILVLVFAIAGFSLYVIKTKPGINLSKTIQKKESSILNIDDDLSDIENLENELAPADIDTKINLDESGDLGVDESELDGLLNSISDLDGIDGELGSDPLEFDLGI